MEVEAAAEVPVGAAAEAAVAAVFRVAGQAAAAAAVFHAAVQAAAAAAVSRAAVLAAAEAASAKAHQELISAAIILPKCRRPEETFRHSRRRREETVRHSRRREETVLYLSETAVEADIAAIAGIQSQAVHIIIKKVIQRMF